MNSESIRTGGTDAAGTFALGQGWAWPAAVVGLFIALIYLPAHHSGDAGGDALVAAVGGLYVVGLSVALPRLVRGGILRLAGARDPIALFGRGTDPLGAVAIRPRWRLAAIGAGVVASSIAGIGAGALASVAEQVGYGHALASLALGANVVLAAGALVPIPGFTGWALLLAVVDAAGTPVELRVRRAARLAHGVGFPLFLVVGFAAGLLGDPMLMLTGFLLAMLSWTQTDLAVGHDHIARFLGARIVGDLARPVANHVDADAPVDGVVTHEADARFVTVVETRGALVGAIGPRQLDEGARRRAGQRCSEIMVPIENVPPLPAATPAATLLPALGRHGFVLVRMPGGLAYIEAADLLDRILGGDAVREPGGVSP